MHDEYQPGQRWISESEPELGLGTILRLTPRTVVSEFKASGQVREYARNNAPLRRVRFRVGDTIESRNGISLTVRSIGERGGILFYRGDGRECSETDLSDTISFNKPEERLFSGRFDSVQAYDLRLAALEYQYKRRKSKVRGFLGGRIDLLSHQIYIASEVTRRLIPRVLLADEVGLGKTIEACLILHRLILTGRIQRALILVPESLVHQWFVELLRRFNLWFHIYDAERCEAAANGNPFLEAQFILCNIALLTSSEQRAREALEAGWDMLVVDEAHHLQWSPDATSPEYELVEKLSRQTTGVLLLTATPEQLGMAGHFARLRLLDPDRFYDLQVFLQETQHYRDIAVQAGSLKPGPELDALLDRHGTGRVHLRNTRTTIAGFPERIVQMHPLDPGKSADPRIAWLAGLLRDLDPKKVLLICRTPDTVALVESGLRRRMGIELAVFHEGLTLLQRDRNAAWFAEKNGARVLLSSEIGSEGRNFQFAHHLVLFDLPQDPEVLEQRIGRLDRIGQTSAVHIHVPFVRDSFQEVLALWYHDGLDAFENQLEGGRELLEHFGERIEGVKSREQLQTLIEETRVMRDRIAARLHEGRDRLLELNSFRPAVAAQLVDEIRREDEDGTLEAFMLAVLDFFSIQVEGIAARTYKVGSAGVLVESFPGLPADGFVITCDRRRALLREDVQFLTWDHPLVTGALDLILGSEKGNCAAPEDEDEEEGGGNPVLEAVYVLECIAPAAMHVDRFLPPTPVRVVTADGDLDQMLASAQRLADVHVPKVVEAARQEMRARLKTEIERLRELRQVNPSVRGEEVDLLIAEERALDAHLSRARLRLDAVKLTRGEGV